MTPQDILQQFGLRETMDYDVVIVGGGPAGLATAIRVKQLNPDASVVVLEKGSEPGAHIQCAELSALRHQGSDAEHRVGHARRWRRPQLHRHVTRRTEP